MLLASLGAARHHGDFLHVYFPVSDYHVRWALVVKHPAVERCDLGRGYTKFRARCRRECFSVDCQVFEHGNILHIHRVQLQQ